MRLKKILLSIVIVILLLLTLYFQLMVHPVPTKVEPTNTNEILPATTPLVPNKEKVEEPSTKTDEQQQQPRVIPTPPEIESIKHSPTPDPHDDDDVKLEEQSYSIHNTKKDIPITPGISLEPGKSINVKVSDEDEVIRVQRDKKYHPGSYNVLWEKKY